ncbi:MAG TPA: hypothetical protein VHG91_06185 [Longimicrobium sp.]|nr:hypothetical protein [Longimicrobium sp.]
MPEYELPKFDPYGWPYFARLSGEEAARWVDEVYRPYFPLSELSQEALLLMRLRRLDEGSERLVRLRAAIDAMEGADPAVRSVVERWYHAALGYYFYCREAFGEADEAMARARDAVADAIGRRPFLVPMAYDCFGFSLHRARIARNGRRWDEMEAHMDEVRGMLRGALPFCVLADGTGVRLADIQAFYRALPPIADEAREAIADVLDDGARRKRASSKFLEMYRIPGVCIPYP